MEYQIIINNKECGHVSESVEGLFTVFEARLWHSGDELTRLWAVGGGTSVSIGLMRPHSTGAYLRRKYSRSARRELPDSIEYFTNLPVKPEQSSIKTAPVSEAAAPAEQKPEPMPRAVAINVPESRPSEEEDLLWLRRADGTLTAFDGKERFVAIPARLHSEPDSPPVRMKNIEGCEYMIFRY